MSMQVLPTIEGFRAARAKLGRLAFVPTMGALHEGHLSLIRRARELADDVAVSIFVNPTQFAPTEDLEKYPRPIEKDLALCEAEGVSLVFHPSAAEMYPNGLAEVAMLVPKLATDLEAAGRPGHFDGVCRVCAKLFNIAGAQVACFGQKDYQQLAIIRAMVADLNLPLQIEPCPIVREADGLAMSSRNVYLSPADRERALVLNRTLKAATAALKAGEAVPDVEAMMQAKIGEAADELAYAVVRDAANLSPVQSANPEQALVCLATAKFGGVRLLDNRLLTEEK